MLLFPIFNESGRPLVALPIISQRGADISLESLEKYYKLLLIKGKTTPVLTPINHYSNVEWAEQENTITHD